MCKYGSEIGIKGQDSILHQTFPTKEEEEIIVDRKMRKGYLLGILRKDLSSYACPIMLIPRKMSGIPHIITDFRHFKSRPVRTEL